MTQNYLQAAKTCFQSSNVLEITVETAREFASTSNDCKVNSSTNLNSIKSTVQCLNITRADPRVTHELFTMKLNSSKPQQPGTSKRKISHPSKKIRYSTCRRARIANRWQKNDFGHVPKTPDIWQRGQKYTPKVPMPLGQMRRLELKLTFTSQTKAWIL